MTTHNFAKTSNVIKFNFGVVTETHFHCGETYTNTYCSFDYSAGKGGDFVVTDIIVVDADNTAEQNDALIEAALAA